MSRSAAFLLMCIATFFACVPESHAQERRAQSDQQILIQLENDWDAAFYRKDVRFIERVLADEFMATYADGSHGDRAKELSLTSAFDLQIESSSLDGFTVKVYGATAVVWFTRHLVGPSQGQRLEVNYRFTDVFVFREGRWQCVSSHSTRCQDKC